MTIQNNSSGYPLPFARAFAPPVIAQRAPTTSDIAYPLGQEWIYEGNNPYFLVAVSAGSATWVEGSGAAGITTLDANSGSATPSGGIVTLAGGSGISTSASSSTVTFSVTGGGLSYVNAPSNTTFAANTGYVTTSAGSPVTLLLPNTLPFGTVVEVVGMGSAGWVIGQQGGITIHMNSVSTTTGTGGSLASSAQYNTARLVCTVTNSDWVVVASEGVLTVT